MRRGHLKTLDVQQDGAAQGSARDITDEPRQARSATAVAEPEELEILRPLASGSPDLETAGGRLLRVDADGLPPSADTPRALALRHRAGLELRNRWSAPEQATPALLGPPQGRLARATRQITQELQALSEPGSRLDACIAALGSRAASHIFLLALATILVVARPLEKRVNRAAGAAVWGLPAAISESRASDAPVGQLLSRPVLPSTLILPHRAETVTTYQVQPGDTISSIAHRFGISEETVLWNNNLNDADQLTVGDTLRILPMNGLLVSASPEDTVEGLARKYSAEPRAIIDVNHLPAPFTLAPGQQVLVPNAILPDGPQPLPTPPPPAVEPSDTSGPPGATAAPSARPAPPRSAEQRPAPAARPRPLAPPAVQPAAPPPPLPIAPRGGLGWPTNGVITQYFTWYHNGVDIANSTGTPIHAANAGVVISVGWDSTGYGNLIQVDHGGGIVCYYAHLSQFLVRAGDRVAAGQVIGLMGSTGRSTGPHLHFSVIRNGVFQNPFAYLN